MRTKSEEEIAGNKRKSLPNIRYARREIGYLKVELNESEDEIMEYHKDFKLSEMKLKN